MDRTPSPCSPPFGADLDDSVFFLQSEDDSNSRLYKSKLSQLYTSQPLQLVQMGIIALFQRKPLPAGRSLVNLNSTVRSLLSEDISEFILPFYQDRILKKCMWILREELKDYQSTEENFVVVLADTWNYFFRQLLPAVQVIMQGVCLYGGKGVRQLTLLSFRDEMLLRIKNIKGLPKALLKYSGMEGVGIGANDSVLDVYRQMFLVLLSAKDISTGFVELESLAVQIICPLMTVRSVYYSTNIPPLVSLSASEETTAMKKATSATNLRSQQYLMESLTPTSTLPRQPKVNKHKRNKSQSVEFIKELFGSTSSGTDRLRTQSQSDIL